MFQHQGMWLPDGERHFVEWTTKNGEIVDGRGTYQIKKWRACLPWIKNWRTAIDCGSHIGYWALQMAKRFGRVEAFEPMAQFRECFVENVHGTNVKLHECALGSGEASVAMVYEQWDSGGTHVGGPGDIRMRTLDSFMFDNVDYIKIDCEGYELEVLKGARETIERYRPCVIVEQKPHKLMANYGTKGAPAVDYLKAMGAVVRAELSGDFILTFD